MRCAAGLFRSENGGDSWKQLADTPGQLLAPDYGAPGRIFWGTDAGLNASMDDGDTWTLIMPNFALTTLPTFLPSIDVNK